MQEPLSQIRHKVGLIREELEKRGFRVSAVYLFGSYAKGDWLKTSDIDLVVVSDDFCKIKFSERLDLVNKIIWERGLGNVEILPFTSLEIEKSESTVLRDAKKYWIRII